MWDFWSKSAVWVVLEEADINILPGILKANVKLDQVFLPQALSENDFRISIKIPNGTPVAMQDVPQIDYVWLDGKPVVNTDEIALRIARGDYGFMMGRRILAFGLWPLGQSCFSSAVG